MNNAKPCLRLAEYERLSVKKRKDKGAKVAEVASESIDLQHEHVSKRVARDGHAVTSRFVDDGRSAYDETIVREGWEAMLKAIASGQVDGVIAYNEDRLVRQPIDGIHLMNAAKAAGIPVMVGDGGKTYDFTDSNDEFMFLVSCGLGKKSSQDTARRVRDTLERNRVTGKQHGQVGYGFKVDPAKPNGPTIVNPAHAAVIRTVAERVLAGHTWLDIIADLNADGVRTDSRASTTFNRSTLRMVMLSPRLAGHLVHRGEIVGTIPGEPILDEATWRAVRSELLSRKRGRPYAPKSALAGILTCCCGAPMTAAPAHSKDRQGRPRVYRVYSCSTAHSKPRDERHQNTIMAWAPEQVARQAVLDWQSATANADALAESRFGITEKRAELEAEMERLRKASARNTRKLDAGIWTEAEYAEVEGPIEERILATKAELERYEDVGLLRELSVKALTEDYDSPDTTNEQRRMMIRIALASITVAPVAKGTPITERVQFTPRVADAA